MERSTLRKTKISTDTASSSKSLKTNNCNERKPLSDLTNFSLIPTETLRKLCSNQLSPSKAQHLLFKPQALARPNSQKPYNSKSDSKSDTSIGSSNFINTRNCDAQNPACIPHQIPGFSSTIPGDDNSKFAVCSRRRPVENLEGQTNIDTGRVSSTCVEKTKDEGRLVSVPFSIAPAKKEKCIQKAIAVSYNLLSSEKATATVKVIAGPLSSISLEKLKHRVKATAVPLSSTPTEKLIEKGKENALLFSSPTVGKTKNKGKALAIPFSRLNEETTDKGKSATMLINCPLMNKRKEKNNVDTALSSCPPCLRMRSIRDKLNQAGDVKPSRACTDPRPKRKKKSPELVQKDTLSPELVKLKAYYEEVDAFELPVEEASDSNLD